MKIRALFVTLSVALSLGMNASPVFSQAGNLANPVVQNDKAPASFKARFDTSKGVFVIEVQRDWAPNGADRFYNMVKSGFFDNARFFRVVSDFMLQFGINGDPKIMASWRAVTIKDDPVKQSNKRGFVTFATSGVNSRTTQVFVNYTDNSGLDRQGFSPFGRVTAGMDVVDKMFNEYGDGPPRGNGPDQTRIQMEGNSYLAKSFPKLDFVKKATIEK